MAETVIIEGDTARTQDRMRGPAAELVLQTLLAAGVDLTFTCPGSTESAFLDASLVHPEMRIVLTTHESIAVTAAEGYARATGQPAVAYLHANVGLANGVSHLPTAQQSQSPVIVLNGMKSTVIQNRDGYTTASHQRDYVRQHVTYERIALRGDQIADDLVRALKAASSDPKGPVYLGLPQDLMETEVPLAIPDVKRRLAPSRRLPDPAALREAAETLLRARSPAVVIGSEAARSHAHGEALEVAGLLDAPVFIEDRRTNDTVAAGMATGPLFAGIYNTTHDAIRNADVIFFAGMPALIEFEAAPAPLVPPGATIIHLCSDAREIGKNAPVDVALCGDAGLTLCALRALLEVPHGPAREARAAHRDAAVRAHAVRSSTRRDAAQQRFAEVPVATSALCRRLAIDLPDDAIVVAEAVTTGLEVQELLIVDSRRTYYTTTGGSLGWGMGAPIGVSLARPGERIYAVVGDGVFLFGVQALTTAVALELPISFIVVDNESYAAVKAALKRYRRGETRPFPASNIAGPDFSAMARSFGARGTTVTELSALPAALAGAAAHAGPSVIVVKTDPDDTGP